jgi:septal ring factor EnvC (AmiA/AmiB activator)
LSAPGRLLRAAVLIGAAVLPAAAAGQSEQRLEEKKARLEELRRAAEQAAERLERTRERKASAREAVFDLEERIGELRRKRRANRRTLSETRARLGELAGRRDRLRERIGEHRQRLGAYLRAAYRAGDRGFLRQLFGHEDPQAVQRSLTYLGYLHRARRERVAALKRDRRRLAEVMERIRERRAEVRRLQDELARQKESLQARMAERRSLLEDLASRAQRQEQRLGQLRSDQKALRRVVERLRRLRERGILVDVGDKHMAELKGRLALPVADPEIRARFGEPRSGHAMQWQGILLGAQAGTEVSAVFRGRVAYADRLRGYGLILIVDHGDGLLTLYAHNRALFKEVGEWVETGETVAEVGTTGGRRDPATYFEIRKGGDPVDPLAWCRSPGGSG